MTKKTAILTGLALAPLTVLGQERPPGLRDPGQLPPNRPLAVPT